MNEIDEPATPDQHRREGRRRRRGRPLSDTHRWLAVAAVLGGLGLAAAACSSQPSSPGVAGAGETSTSSGSTANQATAGSNAVQASALLAYSQCMRSHGVPDFPDPNAQGQILVQGGAGSALNPNSPSFEAAQKACQSKMPAPTATQQAQAMQNALKQSQCMRAHGITDFPDPTGSGGRVTLHVHASPGSDLNPNDPLFQAAQKACMPGAASVNPKGGGGPLSTSSGSGSSSGLQLSPG
jgi:hypothetical protein